MGWTRRDFATNLGRVFEERRRRIGAQIKRERRLRGLTQEDLAHEAGLSYKTIQRIESPNPKHDLRPSTLRKVSRVLELDTRELLVLLYGYNDDEARPDLRA